ncbi:hypothetical protein SYNTR_1037 [Candidatus Syntrophocurvum alkaliphilum]|uniref:Uncharacterized protein n=1 Tax=Candidatus Syntrophocurvum alkaliphilum TaxID=2293317 RepID=A0A6I6DGY1_9FIRM|nr:phasin family protein [Candidatus Syntrophocurvum alkaliphilum]QGT99630.1 hypothetical protein SYNTR_1037 [Candidatus Syntrophocurvum alkaliphilum]
MSLKENFEKSFTVSDSAAEKMWDMWLVSLGSLSWTQDQLESMLNKYVEQRKIAREESTKIIEELMGQTKKNQQQMQKLFQDAVIQALENANIPTTNNIQDLNKKVDELSAKVDKLK